MNTGYRVYPVALTIAGFDPDGGAGVLADIKTFSALGVYGLAIITSITIQNTYEFIDKMDIDPEIIDKQLTLLLSDTGFDSIKIGMLSSKKIVDLLAEKLKRYDVPIVLDPVMKSKTGGTLLNEDALDDLKNRLIPITTVVTPNRFEAEILTNIRITTIEEAKKAAKKIVEDLGTKCAIVKGGHIEGDEAIDIVYDGKRFYELRSKRLTGCLHGIGCVFSAAIAAYLAKGFNVLESIRNAKKFIEKAIVYGITRCKGYCISNPIANLEIDAERYRVLENLRKALEILKLHGESVSEYIPEVQSNLVMCLDPRYARTIYDVAGIKGRIVRYGNDVKPVGPIEFGASKHLARAVLEISKYYPSIRAAMNLKFDRAFIEMAKKLGFNVVFVDRGEEPEDIKRIEGASIPWIMRKAVEKSGDRVPDIVYDEGAWGKEPMIRVFGVDAIDVVQKIVKVIEALKRLK